MYKSLEKFSARWSGPGNEYIAYCDLRYKNNKKLPWRICLYDLNHICSRKFCMGIKKRKT